MEGRKGQCPLRNNALALGAGNCLKCPQEDPLGKGHQQSKTLGPVPSSGLGLEPGLGSHQKGRWQALEAAVVVKRAPLRTSPGDPSDLPLRSPVATSVQAPLTPCQAEWAPLPFVWGLPTGTPVSCSPSSPWATAGLLC